MVAYISASPNPVIFTYPDVIFRRQLSISVGWDTGNASVRGQVFRSLNGNAEAALAGPSLSKGSAAQTIALDQVLTFILRSVRNGQELARTTVTTQKSPQAAYMTDPDRDFIFSLNVNPGVDTIGISFQTKQSAVPYVEIRRRDTGELVDGWMGSGGLRQQHQHEFNGVGRGLPQDTLFDVRIIAMKDIGGGRVCMGSACKNPEIRGAVTTGTRTVTFQFDLVHVRRDGDPGGAGEFTFAFGAGDVVSQTPLGKAEFWGEGDIADGGDRQVAKVITIQKAPRRLWAQVNAWEDDSSFFNPQTWGLGRAGIGPSFDPPGSKGYETDYGSFATVTAHFDSDETTSGRQRGFVLSTGNFSIAYDVYGSMTVTRRNGTSLFRGKRLGRVQPRPRRTQRLLAQSVTLPAGRTWTVGTPRGFATVCLDPEGAVLLRTMEPRTGAGSIVKLGGGFETAVTLVACSQGTLHALGLTPSGAVVARTLMPQSAIEADWIQLGGAFSGAVTSVARNGHIDVLAHDHEGRVFHRLLPAGECEGDWCPIGGEVASPVAAIGTPAGELAVFGLGTAGRIVHKRLSADGAWTPRSDEWEALCRVDEHIAAHGSIAVHWETDNDLIVSVCSGDELAGTLLWQGYPEPDSEASWVGVAEPNTDALSESLA